MADTHTNTCRHTQKRMETHTDTAESLVNNAEDSMVRKLVCPVHVVQSVCRRKGEQPPPEHMGSESRRCVASKSFSQVCVSPEEKRGAFQ